MTIFTAETQPKNQANCGSELVTAEQRNSRKARNPLPPYVLDLR